MTQTTAEQTTNPLQAKFQIVTETILPHKCSGCGLNADGKRQFIDFGLSFDYEGAVYLCVESCGMEIARLYDLVPTVEVEAIIQESIASVAVLQDELDAEKVKNIDLTSRLAALDLLSDNSNGVGVLDSIASALQELRSSVQGLGDSLLEETKRRSDKSDSGS